MPKPQTPLTSSIVKQYGLAAGANVAGIASAGAFTAAPESFHPTDALKDCLSVIVLGAAFPPEALDSSAVYTEHRKDMIEQINGIAKEVEKRIKEHGYKAKMISGFGGRWVDGISHGLISLKHAAELAGLGVIGENYLLNNPEYGNLLWFSAVLTDAELTPDERIQESACDHCGKCVQACPSGALHDPASFGKKACAGTFMKMVEGKWVISCYLCRKVCPRWLGNR